MASGTASVKDVLTLVQAFMAAEGTPDRLPKIMPEGIVLVDGAVLSRTARIHIGTHEATLGSIAFALYAEALGWQLAEYHAKCEASREAYLPFVVKLKVSAPLKTKDLSALRDALVQAKAGESGARTVALPPSAAPSVPSKRARGDAAADSDGEDVDGPALKRARHESSDEHDHRAPTGAVALPTDPPPAHDSRAYIRRIATLPSLAAQFREVRALERPLHDRSSVLCAPTKLGRTFAPVVELVRKAAETRTAAARARLAVERKNAQAQQAYSRYEDMRTEEQILKDTAGVDTAGFGIDTTGTHMPGGAVAASAGTVARSGATGAKSAPAPAAKPDAARGTGAMASAATGKSATGSASSSRTASRPIVIVPPATASGLITSLNAREFLEAGKYLTKDEVTAAHAASGMTGPPRGATSLVRVVRDDARVPFRLVDNPRSLLADEWDSVVAVFVIGPLWQFRDFPEALRSPVELFSRVRGYYVHFADEPVPDTVARWNVMDVRLQRSGRHRDASAMVDVWADLEAFIRLRKRTIAYPTP